MSSWKEIAAYLGVGVRTAQLWERERGLPVRRLPGRRGVVRASVADLEDWKAGGATKYDIARPAAAGITVLRKPQRLRYRLAIGAVLLILGAGARRTWGTGEPATFRVEQNAFIAVDDRGRECWRKVIPGLQLAEFRDHAPVWVGDLDGDGRNEVLLVPRASGATPPLTCFSHTGAERWRYSVSRTVRTKTQVFAPPFSISAFAVMRDRRIVVSSHHTYYPAQVALLSPDGRVVREYWHSGQLTKVLVRDRDGLVYLGGISNARKAATLVVLDEEHWAGASDEPVEYQLLGMPAGRERARILFPRPCITQRFEPFNAAGELQRQSGEVVVNVHERMDSRMQPSILYQFTRDLRLREAVPSSNFIAEHHYLHLAGELDHEFSDAEKAKLARVEYLAPPAAASAGASGR